MQELMPSWVGATAKQIARAVRRGDASATQVVADHLDHIARGDADLSAFRVVRGGEAIVEAEKVDEQDDLANLPLAGVPIAVKENTAVAGLPTWNGSAAARTAVAEFDHEVVRRLRGAGAVIVGVTRCRNWACGVDRRPEARSPATRGTPTAPRAARPGERRRRSPPAWCRSRTATTGSAHCASRPPAAAWSGSSPAPGWCPANSAPRTGSG